MITKMIREVKILTAEFNEGKIQFIKISIDQYYHSWPPRVFTCERGREFQIVGELGKCVGATFEEIEIIKQAYERALKFDFSNFQLPENK